MRALTARLNIGPALLRVAATGADFIPRTLSDPFRTVLLRAVLGGPFNALPDCVGPHGVRQQGEIRTLRGPEIASLPAVDQLCTEFVALVRAHVGALPGLTQWVPNEVSIQRYEAGCRGISVHLDGKRYRQLIAVFTLAGAAPFATCTDREGTVDREWVAAPTSLVLLRGPGLGAESDGRPLHAVRGPARGQRISLTLRCGVRAPPRPLPVRP